MKFRAWKVSLIGGIIVLFAHTCLFAQEQYSLTIPNQKPVYKTDFLKMGTSKSPSGVALSYNSSYLLKNGQPWFPIMGELHFSRVAKSEWEASILKMKAAGIQIISTYVIWPIHEETEGVFNWKGDYDLTAFLALCKKHHLYVWLRPGPFIHAEIRRAGFPDWLVTKKLVLRSNDSTYLYYSNRWFKNIAAQCKGFYFKDGGPIIGFQVENELAYKRAEKYEHMKTLKKQLLDAGVDVPYYSAFAAGPEDQDEFLYTIGSYPDSPWSQSTKKLFKPMFFIKRLEGDSDIGSDLFGKVDNRVRNNYPKLSAEIGSGMQVTYHRRVIVNPNDVVGVAFTKVASGLNGLGYYMYHGGVNPLGKTTLHEGRATNSPNDVPVRNYDFQAPLGAMNIDAESNAEYRLLHLFLSDFGGQLVTKPAFFPKKLVRSYAPIDTVQSSIRVSDGSGFIFLNNYMRFANLPSVTNFQLNIQHASTSEKIPAKPYNFPANSFAIWPYNLKIGQANLVYATAQPLCVLNKTTYVFFTQADAEFVFDSTPISALKNCTSRDEQGKTSVHVSKDAIAFFQLKDGKSVLVLPKKEALLANKINSQGKEYLLFTKASITINGAAIELEQVAKSGDLEIQVFPKAVMRSPIRALSFVTPKDNELLTKIQVKVALSAEGKADSKLSTVAFSTERAIAYQDSILKEHAKGRMFNAKQPGPLYQMQFENFVNQKLYTLHYQIKDNPLVKNWLINFAYTGDMLALYQTNRLRYDQFNYNNSCNFVMSSAEIKQKDNWKLQIFPLNKTYDIYVEDAFEGSKNKEWVVGGLHTIQITPIWKFQINLNAYENEK
ncbi:beta-galactosidase [Pedobacter sp. MW01-1-1]|uniref:beta-galactosidase n=1 Tax=Pedobacter sp. MW01-1-1 TaxID=3383027 RepID=UPI003FEF82C1